MKKTPEELMLLGMLSQMPQEQQDQVKAAKQAIMAIVDKAGDLGFVALSLAGAELAAKCGA